MTYRGDFLLGTLLRFLPMVTTILLWQAILQRDQEKRRSTSSAKTEMIAYLLAHQYQPDVLEHAGPGRRNRARDPRRHDEALHAPADRSDLVICSSTGWRTR